MPSIVVLPWACSLFCLVKYPVVTETETIVRAAALIQAYNPSLHNNKLACLNFADYLQYQIGVWTYLYVGASWLLKAKDPTIPPTPPIPTIVAEQNAHFHCPTMFTPWYASAAGTFAFDDPTRRKAPKYRTEGFAANPSTETKIGGKEPYFPIHTNFQVFFDIELGKMGIASIAVDTVNHDLSLFLTQELPRIFCSFWEINLDSGS